MRDFRRPPVFLWMTPFTMALSISLYASPMSLSTGLSSASEDGMVARLAVMATRTWGRPATKSETACTRRAAVEFATTNAECCSACRDRDSNARSGKLPEGDNLIIEVALQRSVQLWWLIRNTGHSSKERTFFTRVATADLRDLLYSRAFSAVFWRCREFCLASTWKTVARAGTGRREAARRWIA